jgi:predicted phage replisome organizer
MGDNKKYYWLKLMNDFFTQPRIKKLRKIAGGDTYTIIYLKLQLLSLKNDGVLIFEGIEDNVIEELALTIDEDVENVQVTFQYLLKQGLIEPMANDSYLMTETQYLIGSETASAERVRKHRKSKKALQCNNEVTQVKQLVTNCNTEIELEKEIEKDKEIDIEKEKIKNICNVSETEPLPPHVITLTLNTKEEYPIYQSDIDDWKDIYPNVDVLQELRKMKGWLNANPSRRKTKKGIARFINNWLAKEQDKPHYNQPALHNVDDEEEKEEEPKKTMMSDEELKLLLDQVKDGVF